MNNYVIITASPFPAIVGRAARPEEARAIADRHAAGNPSIYTERDGRLRLYAVRDAVSGEWARKRQPPARWYAVVPEGETSPDLGTGSRVKREAIRMAKRAAREDGAPYVVAVIDTSDPLDPDFCVGEIPV